MLQETLGTNLPRPRPVTVTLRPENESIETLIVTQEAMILDLAHSHGQEKVRRGRKLKSSETREKPRKSV
jgi:hypothetical protein